MSISSVHFPDISLSHPADEEIPLVNLIGDPQENFYHLGLKDQVGHSALKDHLLKTLSPLKSKVFERPFAKALSWMAKKQTPSSFCQKWMNAYAEGLKLPLADLQAIMAIPELMVAYQKFLVPLPMGCSSLFAMGDNGPLHARVLDFPLLGSFDRYERLLTYSFPHYQKVWSVGSQGMPLPGLTAMNESGISLALHMKFHGDFYSAGSNIFEILTHMIFEARSLPSMLKILKSYKSMVKWGLYICDAKGEVYEIDIFADKVEVNKFSLHKKNFYYFNNSPTTKGPGGPLGYSFYNNSRKKILEQALLNSKKLTAKEMLFALSRSNPEKGLDISPYTSSSLQTLCMQPSYGSAWVIPGPAPKTLHTKILKCTKTWQGTEFIWESCHKKPMELDLRKAYWHLGQAQTSIDTQDLASAFHHLQMSLLFFKNSKLKLYAQFFFLALKSLHLTDHRELELTLLEWKGLLPSLYAHYKDHAYLFIHRLEKRLYAKSTVRRHMITSVAAQSLMLREEKVPRYLLKYLSSLQFPRIDMGDIFFLY